MSQEVQKAQYYECVADNNCNYTKREFAVLIGIRVYCFSFIMHMGHMTELLTEPERLPYIVTTLTFPSIWCGTQ